MSLSYLPKDCEWCGQPLPTPHVNRMRVHSDCAYEFWKNHRMLAMRAKRATIKAGLSVADTKTRETYAQARLRDRNTIRKRREYVLAHYGGKCACCGEDRYEFLAIDHMGGGGNKHAKQIGRKNLPSWLIKNGFPEGFQVLCHNCNASLAHHGYCPHHPEIKRPVLIGSPRQRPDWMTVV